MDNNRAKLFVSHNKMSKDYYARDAVSLGPIVKLGPTVQQFPVKLKESVTPILRITADHKHMDDLKHIIHGA